MYEAAGGASPYKVPVADRSYAREKSRYVERAFSKLN